MKILILPCFILLLGACNEQEKNKPEVKTYFDLKGYFKKEVDRLNKQYALIDKTVSIDGVAETKSVKIDFNKELATFIDSDINKKSWKGSFSVENKGNIISYTTSNDKIPIKKILITSSNQKIVAIKVFVVNKNILYTSSDSLSYFPDSLYEIKKAQKIKLLSGKKYLVSGRFK